MALIECSNCKKKYSDSISNCIHCGNPTPSFHINVPLNNTNDCTPKNEPTEAETESTEEPKVKTRFYDLPPELVIEFQEEFFKQSDWALKYEQKIRANALFRKTCMICLGTSIVSFLLLIFCAFLIANVAILEVVLIWNFILLAVGIIGTVFFFIRGIRLYTNPKADESSRQFQKWLKKEKNIV